MAIVRQLTDQASLHVAERSPRILLLQGPVGPFFSRLQQALEARGADVTRVLFNSGDKLFGPRRNTVRFTGSVEAWHEWLETRFAEERPDAIILFGAKRPAHRIAREVAAREGIEIVSLEEGYLRSGFVTCEVGGNNDLSPVCGLVPEPEEEIAAPASANLGSSFRIMSLYGFLYYGHRILFTPKSDEPLIHRPLRSVVPEGLFWLRNVLRLVGSKISEAGIIQRLTEGLDKDYFLIPLQMPSDSQMGAAARGWNIERLVDATIRSFAKTGTASRLVFKLHPLDGHARSRENRIREIAEAHGVSERVSILHSGSIAQLAIHSKGMIVINSTSGMTAIHHGTPLLVMGEAVFRNPALVQCGQDEGDIEAFMVDQWVADEATRRRYEQFLAREALAPGDYYGSRGSKIAAAAIAEKVIERATAADSASDASDRAISPSA
ncbi:hypothetical protein [Sphingomicrobium clamense]|uniref:Capsular biosynthesis protein n=1 Tax=Sphingomicrobium clamense TaxID=2851013 RepID=A0ABS6V335_9SPHN|nr:hypothetical protein [Sphingomicrobium sp. B8]MBW0143965.1 hypothetical protein [Sphingomicrobium sp. B8]